MVVAVFLHPPGALSKGNKLLPLAANSPSNPNILTHKAQPTIPCKVQNIAAALFLGTLPLNIKKLGMA